MHRKSRFAVTLSFVAAAFALSACGADIRKTGYFPLQQELDQIEVGQTTRAQVIDLVGSPSVGSAQQDDVIYYLGQRTQHLGPLPPRILERQIVAVSLDSRDRVSNVEVLGLEDGQVVVISQRETAVQSGGVSFFRQLFGNIGNVSAEQLFGN